MVFTVNTDAVQLATMRVVKQAASRQRAIMSTISSGLKVATAKDNAAVFTIAKNARADVSSMNSAIDSLNRGLNLVDVSMAGSQAIADIVSALKERILLAKTFDVGSDQRKAIDVEVKTMLADIDKIAAGATIQDKNLLAGTSGSSEEYIVSENLDRLQVGHRPMTTTDLGINALDVVNAAASALSFIESALTKVNEESGRLGADGRRLQQQKEFLMLRKDTVEVGIGKMVDADLGKENAALQAEGVKLQLAQQGLGFANRSKAFVGRLFGL